MGNRIRARALVAAAGLALASLTACESSGVERSQATQTTMGQFRTDINNYTTQLDATTASLDELLKSASSDPKSAFTKFSGNVDALFKADDAVRGTSNDMKSRGEAYFSEWEKSSSGITNEDVRKIADSRRVELQKEYKELQTEMATVATDSAALRGQIDSLRKYYSQDLTEKGIDASKGLVGNTKSAASKVQKGIKSVLEEVDKVAEQLKVAAPPPPPKEGSTEKTDKK
jgi:chromosome segregation ATPase